jgi:hypothetical protein
MSRLGLRSVTAASVALSLLVAAAPARASAPATSHLRSAAAPATVLVGRSFVVSGAVSPSVAGGKPVYLQRLVAGKWVTLTHKASGKQGVYNFTVRAKGKAGVWTLRVLRPASSKAKGVIGKKMKVLLTKTGFKITTAAVTKVNAGNPVVITGTVTPKATGTVTLEVLRGKTWATLATAVLTSSSYSFSKLLPPNSYPLRVVKAFTSSVAAGESAPVTVTVFTLPVVSPKLALTSPDDALLGLPGHRLIFSTVTSAVTPARSFTYTNTGSGPVTVSGLAIQGTDASSYSLAPGQPTSLTIQPGGTATVSVLFTPTAATHCPVGTGADAYDIGDSVRLAALVFTSSDPGLPGGSADLGGINSCADSGVSEPVLDQVLAALGYTDVVDLPTNRRFLGSAVHIAGTDEVTAHYFRSADPAQPVTLSPLSHYSTDDISAPYHTAGWYAQGAALPADYSCNAACNKLWAFPPDPAQTVFNQNQKLLPVPVGTQTFTPTGNFGLFLGEFTDVNFTDDSFNIAHGTDNLPLVPTQTLHDIRVYPAYGVNHVAIPNTYIVAVDVTRVPAAKNYDYQDVVMVLHNAVPVS